MSASGCWAMLAGIRSSIAVQRGIEAMKARQFSTIELCAGGGGTALGLEKAGFHPDVLIDVDPHSCATLRANRSYWNVIKADIRQFDPEHWGSPDLLSGGLPCPPFSIAGKQLGESDERDLFPSMIRIARKVKPRSILIENVRGLMSSKFKGYRDWIESKLNRLGFDVHWLMLNAEDCGVPQTRIRVFLIALRRGETKPPVVKNPEQATPTVADAISDLMGSRGWHGLAEWKERAQHVAPTIVGGSRKHGGPDLGPTRARMQWAKLGVDGMGLADAAPEREFTGMPRLTVRMVARLQSFPDGWKFAGSKTNAYKQVGNALPVDLAATVGRVVKQCLA